MSGLYIVIIALLAVSIGLSLLIAGGIRGRDRQVPSPARCPCGCGRPATGYWDGMHG